MLPSSPVPLKRTTDQVFDAGVDHVKLSPSGNAKNIRVIYAAIRQRRDEDIVRAGYDNNGKPFIEFCRKKRMAADREKYSTDVRKQREEFAKILWNTAETAGRTFKYSSEAQRDAIGLLKKASRSIPIDRDFRVSDLKPHLKVLNNAYQQGVIKAWQEKDVDPYREAPAQKIRIRKQRAKQFLAMESATRLRLVNALTRPEDKGPETAIAAIKAMDDFMRHYLIPKESHREFVRKTSENEDLQNFCRRWVAAHPLSKSKGAIYRQDHKFEPYSWSRLLDVICPLVIKERRRHTAIYPESGGRLVRNEVNFQQASVRTSKSIADSSSEETAPKTAGAYAFSVDTIALGTEPIFVARSQLEEQGAGTQSFVVDVMPLRIEPDFIAQSIIVDRNPDPDDVRY